MRQRVAIECVVTARFEEKHNLDRNQEQRHDDRSYANLAPVRMKAYGVMERGFEIGTLVRRELMVLKASDAHTRKIFEMAS
jgi:hypothetical protein